VRERRGAEFCYVVERKLWKGILGVVGLVAVAGGMYALGGDVPFEGLVARWAGKPDRQVQEAAGAPVQGLTEGEDAAAPAWAVVPGQPVRVDLWALVPEGEGEGEGQPAAAASRFPEFGPLAGTPLYEAFRLERDRLHARQVEALERAFNDSEVGEERRWESHLLMLEMLASREREVELEYMLRAGGYPDAVVAVRGDYANIVVEGVLDEQGASRIGELVVRVAGIAPERIAIVDGYREP